MGVGRGLRYGSCEAEMSYDPLGTPEGACRVFHGPRQRLAQGFSEHRPTGLADGRQLPERPVIRMALPQLLHQEAVRQHDEVHVPGLALAVT